MNKSWKKVLAFIGLCIFALPWIMCIGILISYVFSLGLMAILSYSFLAEVFNWGIGRTIIYGTLAHAGVVGLFFGGIAVVGAYDLEEYAGVVMAVELVLLIIACIVIMISNDSLTW